MIKTAIIGFGNVGRATFEALRLSGDFSLVCVVEPEPCDCPVPRLTSAEEISGVDVAILCTPSRLVPDTAEKLLMRGIRTADAYDIHTSIVEVRARLDAAAKAHGSAAVLAAGWDPGSDSVVRALMEAMMPRGISYTNFGPGMSMGHSVAARAVKGVRDALSMTLPAGAGVHRRMVYIETESGADFDAVAAAIKADDYFAHDETHVIKVDSVAALRDTGHGVHITRKGMAGATSNQRAGFDISIDGPALTGQLLVASARAVMRQAPGCYTMIELPPIHLLEGDTEELVRRLV